MNNCKVCGGKEFYKEAGYFFCTECQTQKEDEREEILELRLDGTRVTKRKIRSEKVAKTDHTSQWTTWEQYNFILIGLTEELIELGATPEIKYTVLQLWAFYLKKTEIAFMSTTRRKVPRLAKRFHKKDADIIYGKIRAQKRKRRKPSSNSSIASSQTSDASSTRELNKRKRLMVKAEYDRFASSQESESDAASFVSQSLQSVQSGESQCSESMDRRLKYSRHAKKEFAKLKVLSKKVPLLKRMRYQQSHVTTTYRSGPHVVTPIKLWAILYLALRIHNQDIHLADMLRWEREGHLSYHRLEHLLPQEMTLTDSDVKLLAQNNEITHKGMRKTSAQMAKFIFVYEIECPDLITLINRYRIELNLPERISIYAERLVNLSRPKMIFGERNPSIPNYEGRAMAFIIVVLKVLLGLDGITEYEMSRIAEKLNCEAATIDDPSSRLFSFREWQRYVECRRNVLIKKHFATKFKYDMDRFGNPEFYISFIKSALSRRDEKPEITSTKNMIPRELANAMKRCVSTSEEDGSNSENIEIFPPSLTPQYSYLEQLLENPMYELPHILRTNFSDTKLSYSIKPRKFRKFAARYGIGLEIVKSGLHFVDKFVPQFQKLRMPTIKQLNSLVEVKCRDEENEKPSDCLERKKAFLELKINRVNQSLYDDIQEELTNFKRNETEENFDFGFDAVTSDGKLAIASRKDRKKNKKSATKRSDKAENVIDSEDLSFYKKYNLKLPENPKSNGSISLGKSFRRSEKEFPRNIGGRFVPEQSNETVKEDHVFKSPRKKKSLNKTKQNPEIVFSKFQIESSDDSFRSTVLPVSEKLFIPSEDYWMYHCVFSLVKPKNFESFESELPVSFQWLLNECADVVEMSTEDLYEQVCLVETYFAHILNPVYLQNKLSQCCKDNRKKDRLCKYKW